MTETTTMSDVTVTTRVVCDMNAPASCREPFDPASCRVPITMDTDIIWEPGGREVFEEWLAREDRKNRRPWNGGHPFGY